MFINILVYLLPIYASFFVFCGSTVAVEAPRTSFEQVLALACDIRLNPQNPASEEKQRVEILLKSINALLPNYQEPTLEASIGAFLQDSLSENTSYQIIDASDTPLTGKSSDEVFLIEDSEGRLKYIVKAFKEPQQPISKFLPEISALSFIMQLNMDNAAPVIPLAAATCVHDNAEYGLLLETAATGMRLDMWIYAIANHPIGSKERQNVLEEAQKAFVKLGGALAELHKVKSEAPGKIPDEPVKKLQSKYQTLLNFEYSAKVAQDLDMVALGTYIEKLIQKTEAIPCYLTYSHGDMHLGNALYDPALDQVYFIDVAKMHSSFDNEGAPLADGTIDIIRVEENLRRKGYGYLTPQEIDVLLQGYTQEYEDYQKSPINPILKEFYTAYIKLGRIKDYTDWEMNTDPALRLREKGIYEEVIRYFNACFE